MRYLFFIFALLTFIAPINEVEAGNTVSVNRGDVMKPLSWQINNTVSNCDPTTSYQNGSDIKNRWISSPRSSSGTENFDNTMIVNAPVAGNWQDYTFTCSLTSDPSVFDTSTLRICNNTTHRSDGGSSCTAIPAPTINSFTGPASVNSGTSPTLNWNVSNVTSCTINQGVGAANPATGGSVAAPTISSATAYTLSCMNGAVGPTTRQVTVTINVVAPANPPATMSGSCPAPGTTATVSWPAVGGATHYALRVDNQTSGGWNGTCNASAGDFCQDIVGLSHPFASLASNQYNTWVHACNAGGCSATAASVNFTCTPPAPPSPATFNAATSGTCGGQIDLSWSASSGATSYEVSTNGGVNWTDVGNVTTHTATGLTPSTAYSQIFLRAKNGTGSSGAVGPRSANSSVACPTAPTSAPTISATPQSCGTGEIQLDWTPVAGATGYEVRDGANLIYNAGGLSFLHSGLSDGSAHNYVVLAKNGLGNGPNSTSIAVSAPSACIYPDLVANPPTFLPASVVQGNMITFTGVIDNVGGVDADPYSNGQFYIDFNGDGNQDMMVPASPVALNTAPGASRTTTGTWNVPPFVTPGTNFQVGYFADSPSSVDEGPGDSPWVNWSGWSAPFTVLPSVVAPATAPQNLTATPQSCGTGEIRLSWDGVAGAMTYELRDGPAVVYAGPGLTYNHFGLPNSSFHSYTVYARNVAGYGPVSVVVPATAPANCGVPVLNTPTHVSVTQDSAIIGASVVSDGGSAIFSNGVCWGTSTDPVTNCNGIPPSGLGAFTDNVFGLPSGTEIYYRGYAENGVGRGYSISSSFITIPDTPASPTAVPQACGTGQIDISWTGVNGANDYTVVDNFVDVLTIAGTSYTHSGLIAGSNHDYRIRANNISGSSPDSFSSSVVAPADCTYADLIANTVSSPASVNLGETINFTANVSNTGAVTAGTYDVNLFYIDADGDGNHEYTVPASAVTSVTNPGGDAVVTGSWAVPLATTVGANYRVAYFADVNNVVDEGPGDGPWVNWSNWSAPFSVSTPAPSTPGTQPPAGNPPVSASTAGSCGGSIDVSWGPSDYATWYDISINNGAPVWSYSVADPATSYTISGLSVNTAYNNIKVRARNGSGSSLPSGAVSATASNYCQVLNVSSCPSGYIENGDATCAGNVVNWDITGATPATANITRMLPLPVLGLLDPTTPVGGPLPITLYHGTNNIAARDNNIIVQDRTLNITCRPESFFYTSGSGVCEPRPTLISPSAPVIRSGKTASLTFRVQASYPLNCTFSNGMALGSGFSYPGTGVEIPYTVSTIPLTSGQVIEMSCNTPTNDIVPPATTQVRVNVIPNPYEN